MASLTSVSFGTFSACFWIFVLAYGDFDEDIPLEEYDGSFMASEEFEEITAFPGDTVTLPCKRPTYTNITAVEWTKPDLEPEYVLVYKDNQSDLVHQHPSFKNQVELKDSEKKDGDVSLIVKDVMSDDAGKYRCYVSTDTESSESFVILYVHPEISPGVGFHGSLWPSDVYEVEQIGQSPFSVIEITAFPGDTVTLPCKRPTYTNITAVEWTRPDLEPEYVFVHRDNPSDPVHQHPSFKNQVELKDSEKKDGDVSLIVKDVMSDDAGKYRCYVSTDTESSESFVILYVHPAPINITFECGETVSLPCDHPSNTMIRTVKLIRSDLDPETVYFNSVNNFRRNHDQHPSFKNRVELKFCDMMYGKMSLILKNVSSNDSGTYECHVYIGREIISVIHLDVYPSADRGLTILKIVLYIVVFCPYFISTLLMVSLYRHRPSGRNLPFSSMTSQPCSVHEGSDKEIDDTATEHYF